MDLMVNPVITDFRQDVNGDIKMLKLGTNKEDAYANIIGQAEGADLENNKAATINVSTYTEPVVINPTSGKDGMKKATITLSNIPSPSNKLYGWSSEDPEAFCYTTISNPTTSNRVLGSVSGVMYDATGNITVVGEDTITVDFDILEPIVFTRDSTKDIDM